MKQSKLRLVVKGCRAVNDATIEVGDITVLSGINACGKSTLAHLVHVLVNLNRDYARLASDYAWRPIARMVHALSRFGSQMEDLCGPECSGGEAERMAELRRKTYVPDWEARTSAFLKMLAIAFWRYGMAHAKDAAESDRCYRAFLADIKFETEGLPDEPTVQSWLVRHLAQAGGKRDELMKDRSPLVWSEASREAVRWIAYKGDVSLYEDDTCVYASASNSPVLREILGVEHAFYVESPWRNQIGTDSETGTVSIGDGFTFEHPDAAFVPDVDLFAALEGRLDELSDESKSSILERVLMMRKDSRIVYVRDDGHEPFPLEECATGIKSLSILNFLYTRGCLNNKTLLVIDEPEAHLHPQWILEYAKILVRLNRRLGVRLLITTHSPDMLNAVRRVANVEEVPDLHFYLADEVSPNQKYDFNYLDLGREVEPIFAKFNLAADKAEAYPDDN